jgi:shikimate dehydrogenase
MDNYGLLGEKLSYSLSPEIHNKIFEMTNINGAYKIFEMPKGKTGRYADFIRTSQIKGVNVTIPYKQAVMNDLDEISAEAMRINAVNTILNDNGVLRGYNTDYFGFMALLKKNNINAAGKDAAVLGTGGAAQAVFACLNDLKAKNIYAVSRNKKNKEGCVSGVKYIDYEELEDLSAYALINATPVGTYPDHAASPVKESVVQRFECLIDLIYNPEETEFLRIGKKNGKRVCGGLYMLVMQAVKANEIWHNITIDGQTAEKVFEYISQKGAARHER